MHPETSWSFRQYGTEGIKWAFNRSPFSRSFNRAFKSGLSKVDLESQSRRFKRQLPRIWKSMNETCPKWRIQIGILSLMVDWHIYDARSLFEDSSRYPCQNTAWIFVNLLGLQRRLQTCQFQGKHYYAAVWLTRLENKHELSERLAPLTTWGTGLRAPLKLISTIRLWSSRAFKGTLKSAAMIPQTQVSRCRETPGSRTTKSDRWCFYNLAVAYVGEWGVREGKRGLTYTEAWVPLFLLGTIFKFFSGY